jgi:hypothetical protein
MNTIREYDVVRVASLDGMLCDPEDVLERAPRVGDTAAVLMLLTAPDGDDGYLLECVAAGGYTRWLAIFPRESLERIESTP